MILRRDDFQDVCTMILSAVDSNNLATVTETLALNTDGTNLILAVTNRDYYVKVILDIHEEVDFHATVNAELFLKLVSKITTETIELTCSDTSLTIVGNGTYTLPLVFDGENLLELPRIEIDVETSNFDMSKDNLAGIMNYNSKELKKNAFSKPVQKMYYMDKDGCITFTSGACVNNFTLDTTCKVLLNGKVVQLFKLFDDDTVKVTVGHSPINGSDMVQSKIRFKTDKVEITSLLVNDENMINSVPVDAIRGMATNTYPHSVVISKEEIQDTISRLLIFSDAIKKPYSKFVFSNREVTIFDRDGVNKESIVYANDSNIETPYELTLDLNDLKVVLDGYRGDHITMNFGNNVAVVIQYLGVYNVIPECNL